ncbi:hypothetical protein HZ326_17598 [Fusarium oxysporum f. sp. albedinis]|nr:hypothetical protein HZ326_17598 [Fusarium oxysporum f. sp. albedinis]
MALSCSRQRETSPRKPSPVIFTIWLLFKTMCTGPLLVGRSSLGISFGRLQIMVAPITWRFSEELEARNPQYATLGWGEAREVPGLLQVVEP